MSFHFAYIDPGQIDTRSIRGQIQAACLNAQTRMMKYLEDYTSTWNHPVFWGRYSTYKAGAIMAGIETPDPIFGYLEMGTTIRYATMEVGFKPKTARHRIKSQVGQGGMAYLSKKHPKPGIMPREILPEVIKLDTPKFESDMQKIFVNIKFAGGRETQIG